MWGVGQNRAVHERFSSWQKEREGRRPGGAEQSLCRHDYNLVKTEDEEDLVEAVLGHGNAQTWTKLRPSWPFAPKP